MLTLELLMTQVALRMGIAALDGMFVGTTLQALVNEGLAMVAAEADWPWLQGTAQFQTVPGISEYVPPVGDGHYWVRTRALKPVNDDALINSSLTEVREKAADAATGEAPTMYCISTDKIILAPTPNSVITITHDYISAEPELLVNGDSPLLPLPWRWAAVHAAAYLGHLRQNEAARAQEELKQYNAWIERMKDDRRRSGGTRRIRIRPGSMI